MTRALLLSLCLILAFAAPAAVAQTRTSHGLSLFGDLKYGPDFKQFLYVNPNAPKGGTLRLSSTGGFDNLNPFIAKGNPAPGLTLSYDTLFKRSLDEPGAAYGLIAKSVEVPADSSWALFTLRPEARFQDGSPITADDVVFSFEVLRDKGQPFYRFYYASIAKAEALDKTHVKFTFNKTGNRELPQIVGELPVLSKHYWQGKDFAATTLSPPLGSGPYRIAAVDANQRVTYARVKDYWGADLPVNRGSNNFDQIVYVNFNDPEVELQGLFADAYDFRRENSAKNWATRYDSVPAVQAKQIIREPTKIDQVKPMQAIVLNLRRPKFADPRVRLAFDYALDFEWTNKNLFYGQYARTASFFQSSELAATGLPSPLELELLEPFRAQLPPEVFTQVYSEPKTDGSGNERENLRKAAALLDAAGWHVVNGKLTNAKTGEIMRVEYLDVGGIFEKVILAYKERLARLGITLDYRLVDDSQYINRLHAFDFDMIVTGFAQSLSPGNEQREFWGSAAADRPESRNLAGIKNPVVDALIDKIIFATDRAHLVAATRALDRVLLWNRYVVPTWYAPFDRLAYWDRFGHPTPLPLYDDGFPDIWWYDAAHAAKTGKAKN
jgi:microcin C transport system substrate-binding protein